ncbi:MAG TPA: PAS domain-containing sensor histidine kinase [Kofleriaceae bacterium]|nr:PAS domain-containing sensor histidine kinase [Kofleriaceae bacterium]
MPDKRPAGSSAPPPRTASRSPSETDESASSAILRSEDKWRLFVEAVKDYAIFILDPDGVISSWNAGAERVKGYTASEAMGRHFRMFYTAEAVAARHPEYELEVAKREGAYEEEGWRVRKDGSQFYANVVITAVRDRSGELLGFAKVTRDITERRAAEDELRRAAGDLEERVRERTQQLTQTNEKLEQAFEEAQHAIRMREEVLAVVSHDLRNPLAAIQMAAALLLLRLGADMRSRKQVETIHRSATRMEHLLGDLLDMASIQVGRLSLERRLEDAGEVLHEAMEVHVPSAREKGMHLSRSCDLGDVKLECDRDRVLQVLGNLIGNAIKICQPGDSITVTCVPAGGEALFAVSDTGPGIPEAELPHLFEPYWSAERHAKKGTGLGLYISKGIVEAHGGRLWVESTQGAGATFYFTLPVG